MIKLSNTALIIKSVFFVAFVTAVYVAICKDASATEIVDFSVDGSSGTSQVTGQFVAGATHTVRFTRTDSAWASSAVYKLTIKPRGRYTATPYVVLSGDDFTVSGALLSCSVDLNITELYTALGRARDTSVMLELDGDEAVHSIALSVRVYNSVSRPDDSAPANPAVNTYTDSWHDAKWATVGTPITPVEDPIDGFAVQCTDEGQLDLGTTALSQLMYQIDLYPESTTLSTADYLIIWDASAAAGEGALRKISVNNFITALSTLLGL